MTYVRAEHRHLELVVPEEGIILPIDHISVPHFRCALGIAQNRSEALRRDDIPGNRMCEKNANVPSAQPEAVIRREHCTRLSFVLHAGQVELSN